jgi:hypothetical protein
VSSGGIPQLQTERDFQAVAVHQIGVGKNFPRMAVGLNSAMIENQHPAAEVEDQFQIVGGDQLGGSA